MADTIDQEMRREQELIAAKSLDQATRYFLERWTPRSAIGYEAHDFAADLNALVHRIYAEAQRPLIETAARLMAERPIAPTILPGGVGAGGGINSRAVMSDGSPVPSEATITIGPKGL